MEKDIVSFIENNVKTWQKNEQKRKQAKKRAFFQKPYPCEKDIYGRKKVRTDEQTN